MTNPNAKVREHKSYEQNVSSSPRVAHGRTSDLSREKIARPIGSTPRRAKDWN